MNCINIYLLLFGADLGAILSPQSRRCVFFAGGTSKTPSPSKMAAGGDPAFDAVSVCSAPVTRASERGRVVLSAVHSERLVPQPSGRAWLQGSHFLVVKESC